MKHSGVSRVPLCVCLNVKLTEDVDLHPFGLCHPGFSWNQVGDLAVERLVLVLLHYLHAQLTLDREQTTGFTGDSVFHYHLWRTKTWANTQGKGRKERGNYIKSPKVQGNMEKSVADVGVNLSHRPEYCAVACCLCTRWYSAWGSHFWPHSSQSAGEEGERDRFFICSLAVIL